LSTTGHVGTWVLNPNALGDSTSTLAGEILLEQVGSMNKESPALLGRGVSRKNETALGVARRLSIVVIQSSNSDFRLLKSFQISTIIPSKDFLIPRTSNKYFC
jgi:hypothetical protein